jgi:hypothetical protein
MESQGRSYRVPSGQHIAGNEVFDDEVTVPARRYECPTGRRPGATRGPLRATLPASLGLSAG